MNHDIFLSKTKTNLLQNIFSRDLGILSHHNFMIDINTKRLNDIRLSKYRSAPSSPYSITWLNLDNVEYKYLLVARGDGNFVCFDVLDDNSKKKLKLLFNSAKSKSKKNHSNLISCIQWYPIDSGMFFTSGMDSKFKVWDTNGLDVVDEYFLKHKIYNHHISLHMSTNSRTLVALGLDNGQVRFIDLNSGSFTHTLKAHVDGYCVCVQWSPYDPNILASAGSDGRIALWDIRSSKSCLLYFDYEKTINSELTKFNYSIASSSSKSIAHTGPIKALTYTNNGQHIISLGKDNALRLWNSSSGLNTLVNYGKIPLNSAVAETCIQISTSDLTNPNYVFVPSGNDVLVFEILDGTLLKKYKGHFDSVNCCKYNPINSEFYTGSKDKNILIWSSEKEIISDNEFSKSSFTSSRSTTNFSFSNFNRPSDNWSDDE